MTATDLGPVLRTPTGGAESQPQRPQQWHGHPYVWAWNVSLGATSRTFIEGECQTAANAGAPPDAVYRSRVNGTDHPDEWVTVGMLVIEERQNRVREYAQALIEWERALQAHHKPQRVQPLPDAKQLLVETDDDPEQHEYVIVFRPTHITGVVMARTLREAYQKLAPGEQFMPSGYGVLDLAGDGGVHWRVSFDSTQSEIAETTDKRVSERFRSDELPAEVPVAEVPAAPDVPTHPVMAEDTAATSTPTVGRGARLLRRNQVQP
ncbi:hypothetical protein [Streptomyces sp. Midd1]|uniref:hypothetical protein n=1 Tax=Streptomyces sp. Midd3 TaxID=3161191 RepID=UPI0034DB1BA8